MAQFSNQSNEQTDLSDRKIKAPSKQDEDIAPFNELHDTATSDNDDPKKRKSADIDTDGDSKKLKTDDALTGEAEDAPGDPELEDLSDGSEPENGQYKPCKGDYVLADDEHPALVVQVNQEKEEAEVAWLLSKRGFFADSDLKFPNDAKGKHLLSDQTNMYSFDRLQVWREAHRVCPLYKIVWENDEKGYAIYHLNADKTLGNLAKKGSGKKKCSSCGKTGHNRRFCNV